MIKESVDKRNSEEKQRARFQKLLPLAVTSIALVQILDFIDFKVVQNFADPSWFEMTESRKALFVGLSFNSYSH